MRILSARIFLSFLAGKLKIFKQMLTSNSLKKWRMRILSKSFDGKMKTFKTAFNTEAMAKKNWYYKTEEISSSQFT